MVSPKYCLSVLAFAALSSCGGEDSSAPPLAGTPTPAPVPAPTPSPTAVAYTPNSLPSAANALVGLHQGMPFVSYAWSYGNGSFALNADGAAAQVGYDVAKTSTTVALPGFTAGYLDTLSSSDSLTRSLLVPTGGIEFSMLRPGAANPVLGLEWTSAGSWFPSNRIILHPYEPAGVLAYGIATPASGLPNTDTATYSTWGPSVENYITEGVLGFTYRGELTVNFSGKAVSGHLEIQEIPGGAVILETAALAADGTFAGSVTLNGAAGSYEGRLAGPQAQEVLLRWGAPNGVSGPFKPPAFGVAVGRRR